MSITQATLNLGGQELVLTDDSGKNWRFQTLYTVPNAKRGHGYMQHIEGRFDANGNLDVRDVHNDRASDFEIRCGPGKPYLEQSERVYGNGRVGHNTREREDPNAFPDPIGFATIRVFAGAKPPDDLDRRSGGGGSIGIADPSSVVWGLLSESAFAMSAELDIRSDSDIRRKDPARRRDVPWYEDHITPGDFEIVSLNPVITRKRVLMNLVLEII